ncbi:hypothetical protein BZB76_3125 [Actinomadura pelletieri DSM 43383]|uniref:Uncharacterized protein n=1 Tax=Actinomadura pelletieri DSM 43383 TaxID=1120940 RepID=A0A495QNP7_9ACTN|nr:hypothetical protein BZB76_3125 [Actinomadura pelletieri DSM 43383]
MNPEAARRVAAHGTRVDRSSVEPSTFQVQRKSLYPTLKIYCRVAIPSNGEDACA